MFCLLFGSLGEHADAVMVILNATQFVADVLF